MALFKFPFSGHGMKNWFFALWLVASCASALPAPSMQKVREISASVIEQPLYWTPFRLPYDVSQHSRDKDAQFLQALFEQGLLVREASQVQVSLEVSGVPRNQLEQRWRYDYKEPIKNPEQEGFYYGRGKILSLKLSPAQESALGLYTQVQVKWMVEDIPSWVTGGLFKTARTLRRSLNSAAEPFEKTLYLHYQQGDWVLWQEH